MRTKVILSALVITGVMALMIPAHAGKGGNGGSGGGGGPTGTISPESYSQYWLGGNVGFDTSVSGLAGWQYPAVVVQCFQNGNVVYAVVQAPGTEFKLGGDSSQWVTNGGGASCEADIDAYGWKGGQESIQQLNSLTFQASGS